MLQTISFGTILDPFGPNAAQVLQMGSFGNILEHCGPKAAQMLQMASFATSLNLFFRTAFFSHGFHFGVGFLS